jgi:hypothetical protein
MLVRVQSAQQTIKFNVMSESKLSKETIDFIYDKTKIGTLSLTGMVAVIGYREYEKDKLQPKQLRPLVEKEYDRARKKIGDERKTHIEKYDSKCGICDRELSLKGELEDKPFMDTDGLLCQKCISGISSFYRDVKLLKKAIKYLK